MFTIAAEIPVNLKKVETNILQRIAKKNNSSKGNISKHTKHK